MKIRITPLNSILGLVYIIGTYWLISSIVISVREAVPPAYILVKGDSPELITEFKEAIKYHREPPESVESFGELLIILSAVILVITNAFVFAIAIVKGSVILRPILNKTLFTFKI